MAFEVTRFWGTFKIDAKPIKIDDGESSKFLGGVIPGQQINLSGLYRGGRIARIGYSLMLGDLLAGEAVRCVGSNYIMTDGYNELSRGVLGRLKITAKGSW